MPKSRNHKWLRLLVLALLAPATLRCGSDALVQATATDAGKQVDVLQSGDLTTDSSIVPDVPLSDVPQTDLGGVDVQTPELPLADVPKACPADHCLIEGQCWANFAANPANACQWCLVIGSANGWSANDTPTCDDGKACTSEDRCQDGACKGSSKQCKDDNPCTEDSCDDAGGCVFPPNTVTCTDSNPCTVGDACGGGACLPGGQTLTCDDANLCTTDSCTAGDGCTFVDNSAPCEDGNPCTLADSCAQGACLAGANNPCDDGSICTVDSCDPAVGCQHTSIAAQCKDDNLCTDEGCDPKLGCVYPFNTVPCDDNNKCTGGDTCAQGACLGLGVELSDANTCTDDTCLPDVGPIHTPNALPCDDGNVCTLGDTCSGGGCAAGPKPLTCDDESACTDDSCNPLTGCVFTQNTASCDDGSACTKNDICAAGLCAGVTFSCDDENACTTDSCDAKVGCKHAVVVSNACRPIIVVDYPPRAATIQGGPPTVVVTGSIKSGAGPITGANLNGTALTLGADGSFTFPMSAKPGGNVIVIQATDSLGSAKKHVQSYLWSTTYFKPVLSDPGSGMVDPGLAFYLSQQVIDDGVHTAPYNDLASIFELYLQGMDLNALLPNPAYSGNGYNLTLKNLTYQPAKVSLKSQPGSLHLVATISTLKADLHAQGQNWYTPSFDGTLTMDSIVIEADLVPTVTASHQVDVAMQNVNVTINNPKVQIAGWLGWLVTPILNAFLPQFKGQIETAFKNQIASAIGPALGKAFSALAFNTSFGIGKLDGSGDKITVALKTDFASIDMSDVGTTFFLRAAAYAAKATPYDNLGVPGRIACGNGTQKVTVLQQSPLELVIADDTFNEMLYAAWNGGLLEFPVPPSMLGNIDLSSYGVTDLKLKLSAMLAPTMDDCNPAGDVIAHVGDLKVDASLQLFGQQMDVVVYTTLTAGVQITAANGAIGIALTGVKQADLQVDIAQDNLVSSEGVLEKLVADNLLGSLIGKLSGSALGSFPLPAIDLSGTMPGLPPGVGIAIDPQKVTRMDGNSIVGGVLK